MNKETPAPRPTTGDYVETHWDELDPEVQAYYIKKQEIGRILEEKATVDPEAPANGNSPEAPEVTSIDTKPVDQNPEGLSLYEQAQRDKYLDEGEASQLSPEAPAKVKTPDENPEGLSLYEQAQRDKYLSEGETSQSAEKSKAQQELDAARLAFAKARVDVESHFFKEWFGGKKRKEALQEAADKLKACELAVAKEEMATQIEQLNQLSGEELAKQQELFAQMMAARALQGMQETNQKTTEAYDEMLDQRFMLDEGEQSKFKRVAGKVNKLVAWFRKGVTKAGDKATSGSTLSQWLKLGAGGAAAGAVTAAVATWPITTAVGLGTGLVTAGVVKQSVLESRRGEERTVDNSRGVWQDAFKQAAKDAKNTDEMMESMVDAYVDRNQKSSEEYQEQLRKKVRSAMSKVAIGYAAGSITTGILKSTVFGAESHASGAGHDNVNHASGSESTTGAEHTGSTPSVETPDGGSTTQPEVISPVGSYEYPWDWAVGQFGAENATSELHRLADLAQANGHEVEWIVDGSKEILKVDGSFDTGNIIGVLDQYRHVLAA